MKHTAVKILHYAKDSDNTWSSTSTEVLNCIDAQTNVNIKVKSDAFQMQLYLDSSTTLSSFGFDDKFEVYCKEYDDADDIIEIDTEDSTIVDSTFIFNGILNQWSLGVGADGSKQLVLQGVNVSERLLKVQLPAKYIATGAINNSPEIIQNLIGLVNEYSAGKDITWHPDNPNETSIPFIATNYSAMDRPVYQMVQDLSGDKYTGNGDFYYYIQSRYNGDFFIWRKRTSESDGTTLREGTDFYLGKVEYGIWDTVNFLVIYAGSDAKGTGIKTYYVDLASAGALGTRGKTINLDVAETIHRNEASANPASFPNSEKSRYPSSYPYVTYTDGTSVANDAEYNSWFRTTVRTQAREQGKGVVDKYKYARYKLSANCFEGRNDLTIGKVYLIHAPSVGWDEALGTTERLRLTDIQHTIGADGWNTKLEFEQDWESAVVA